MTTLDSFCLTTLKLNSLGLDYIDVLILSRVAAGEGVTITTLMNDIHELVGINPFTARRRAKLLRDKGFLARQLTEDARVVLLVPGKAFANVVKVISAN